MITFPDAYSIKNSQASKRPVYVVEIFFNGGNTGVDGVNDVYFATCDVNDIVGFPYPALWFPVLQADSISGLSQSVDPINGVSTIGALSVKMTDYGGWVSDIIKAADTAGHGLRRQRIQVSMLFKGMNWTDRVNVRTMQISDLKLSKLNEYTLTATDVQTQLKKTVFNPYKTTVTSAVTTTGAITLSVADARQFLAATSVTYGASGFLKINDEIMRWTSKTSNTFTIPAAGRGMFGTVAATHAIGDAVTEIIYLNENPVTMALSIMESSGVASTNGTYDLLPAHWGCNMDSTNDVAEADWLSIGKLLTGLSATPAAPNGLQFEFVIDKGIEAKKFIEDEILKICGAFGFVRGDGKYSIRAYNDLANTAKENADVWLTVDNVISWGDLQYDYGNLANQLWLDYDEYPRLSGKYIRSILFNDSASVKKWGEAKQLKYTTRGVPPTSIYADQLYQRFQRVMARYSRPPMKIKLTLMPKLHGIQIGDIARVTLPIKDIIGAGSLDRAFEVVSVGLKSNTGEIDVDLIAQPENATFWQQGVGAVYSITISPASVNVVTGNTFQLVARCFDATGNQVPTPAITWTASGNVTVSSTGLVTAGSAGTGSVYAVVGSLQSNTCAVTVAATANTNAVASVTATPTTITFAAGATQTASAQSYDALGSVVQGKTYTWTSSNPAVASVPAGPSASATITAVANGTCTITATETTSSVVSPAIAVTVAAAVTPVFTPPAIANSAYQIGTKITTMGAPGGPHTIPNGYNFAAGDYWFDGDVTLPLGNACTVNGTVRIFSLGVVTINGTVNGKGRGLSGAIANNATTAVGGYFRAQPVAGTGLGFVARGGSTPMLYTNPATYNFPAKDGGLTNYVSVPAITVIGTASSGGSWTAVTGLPTVLHGASGAAGGTLTDVSGGSKASNGGNGGAGLMLMARGIYVSVGQIDLRGDAAAAPTIGAGTKAVAGSGGGGGGSLVCLAERDINGLPVLSVNPNRVLVTGGGAGYNVNTWPIAFATFSSGVPSAGGNGALIAQVIG